MRYKIRKRENDVFVCFLRACKLCKVNVYIRMISLQLLVNQECRTLRRISLDLLATVHIRSRIHVYICIIAQKIRFSRLKEVSVMSVHRKSFTGKKK